MNRKSVLVLSAKTFILSFLVAGAAGAENVQKQAYQAEYELTSSVGKSTHKVAFDGKGHGRSEMISANRHSISVADYTNKKISILMPDGKRVMTVPLDESMMDSMGELGEKIRSTAKPLGTKVIAGHPCTGTHYDLDGGASQEIWTGNDIGGVRVYSKVNTPKFGVSETLLKSFVNSAPAAEAFKLPAG